jgi:hypothetical protein
MKSTKPLNKLIKSKQKKNSTNKASGKTKSVIVVDRFAFAVKCNSASDVKVYANAFTYKDAFEQVWERLFRPRHKHGYTSETINDILKINTLSDDTCSSTNANVLMDTLEQEYQAIRKDFDL